MYKALITTIRTISIFFILIFIQGCSSSIQNIFPYEEKRIKSIDNIAIVVNADPQITYNEFLFRVFFNTEKESKFPMVAWDLPEFVHKTFKEKINEQFSIKHIMPYDTMKNIRPFPKVTNFWKNKTRKYILRESDAIGKNLSFYFKKAYSDSIKGTVISLNEESILVQPISSGIYKPKERSLKRSELINFKVTDYSKLYDEYDIDAVLIVDIPKYGFFHKGAIGKKAHTHQALIRGSMTFIDLKTEYIIFKISHNLLLGTKFKGASNFNDLEKNNFILMKKYLKDIIINFSENLFENLVK